MNRQSIYFVWAAVVALSLACKKEKLDARSPLRGDQVVYGPNSGVRLFNFYNMDLDITANNISLTNYGISGAQGNAIGLALFPDGVWKNSPDGSPVSVPASLLDKQGGLHLKITTSAQRGGSIIPGRGASFFSVDTVLKDDPLNPKDYYALPDGHLKVVERNIAAPTSPDAFKIRILHFGAPNDTLGLYGNVVLTYADGTPVDARLSGVTPGTISPYVELPYGTCQFKLFMTDPSGRPDYTHQLAELPLFPIMGDGGASLPVQQGIVTRVRSYKPGGTYSIVITPGLFGYDPGDGNPLYIQTNAYRVLTEQAAPLNTSYAQLQGVNAFGQGKITFRVDGALLPGAPIYGQAGDYAILVQGAHLVSAVDAGGKVLAERRIKLYPFDNITAWVFDNNGKPDLLFSNTDITSTIYESPAQTSGGGTPVYNDDGTDGSRRILQFNYALQARFLNLSDLSYVTFTKDGQLFRPFLSADVSNPYQADTLAYPQAFINMQPGVLPDRNPFVVFPGFEFLGVIRKNGQSYLTRSSDGLAAAASNPLPLRLYQSAPAKPPFGASVPGNILGDIAPLYTSDLVANPAMYDAGKLRPDNGFYSIAVIGKASLPSSDPGHARMIVIRHNK